MNRLVLLVIIGFTASALAETYETHPDAGLNIFEILEKYGYPYERHTITTADGYILETHRVPHGRNNSGEANKPAVFFMHGLGSSSTDWINSGPENALGMILADLGYDVWLGNARGNVWSRNHVTYDPDVDEAQFWNISWNEIGIYDLPANIDHILQTTGAENLFYIGHSQGCTAFYVMGAERPEYNSKVRLASLMGPAGYMTNLYSPILREIAKYEEDLEWIAEMLGVYEFKPASNFTQSFGEICDDGGFATELCMNIYFLMFGYDSNQLNASLFPVLLTNLPGGSASKQYLHYGQEINSGYFRKWDYHSVDENMAAYGTPEPPSYDTSLITAPIALHYGKNDWLVAVKDVQLLRDELPNVVMDNLIDYEYFNHADFLFATDVVEMLYNDLIGLMESYRYSSK